MHLPRSLRLPLVFIVGAVKSLRHFRKHVLALATIPNRRQRNVFTPTSTPSRCVATAHESCFSAVCSHFDE